MVYPFIAEPSAEELPPEDLPLLPCHVCNRTFLPKPLKKHIPICEQALRRKRKPFDSLKQRVEGTDMAPFYQKSYLKRSSPEMSSLAQAGDVYGNNKVSKWREKHFELQKTIKNAKGSNTRSDMSTHPPSSNSVTPNRKTGHLNVGQTSSNERCPVCDRSFGPKAFDRHVEFCKEQRNRVQVHKSPAVVQQAKERLEARINYRVPPLRQSKRSLVRDKYLPASQTSVLLRSNSTVQAKSTTSISSSVTNMAPNRRQVSNERSVERNNNKKEREATNKTRLDRTIGDCGDTKESLKNETSSTKSVTTPTTPTHYDPFEKAHLQLLELIEDETNSITTSPVSTLSSLSTPIIDFRPFVTVNSTPHSANKRASVIDPPYGFHDPRASRDLDQEFELLESLMNNNLDETSAEEERARRQGDMGEDGDTIDPSLINEQDNLSIPDRMPSEENSPGYEYPPREGRDVGGRHARDTDRHSGDTRDNHSRNNRNRDTRDRRDISQKLGRDTGLINEQVTRDSRDKEDLRAGDTRAPSRDSLDRRPSRQSIKPNVRSLPLIRPDQVRLAPDGSSAESQTVEGRRVSPGSVAMKVKARSKLRIDFSPESQKNRSNRRLGTSNLVGLEIRKALQEEVRNVSPKEEIFNVNSTPTAEELYPDNAIMYEEFKKYEEMYRREKEERSSSSKKQKKITDFGINIDDSCKIYADSAYESLNRKQQSTEQDSSDQLKEFGLSTQSAATTPGERLPKFCHECGNKYPVPSAKFCVECGVRRLVL